MSRSGFHQAFSEHIGRPPGAELHRVRLENAKQLPAKSNMKLEEIAELSGCQSANSFWVAFKKSAGISPKQFQKQFCASGIHSAPTFEPPLHAGK